MNGTTRGRPAGQAGAGSARTRAMGRRMLRTAVVVMVLAMTVPAEAATSRTKPILFIHGYDFAGAAGDDGAATWDKMVSALKAWGWSSPSHLRVAYYKADKNYDHSLDHHGSHNTHQGGSAVHTITNGVWSHDQNTPIEHLAYHLSWLIYSHYSSKGISVELVGYSMGGLIVRDMLAQYQLKDADRPSKLSVQDVVTLGTPHAGTSLANYCSTKQCQQMRPNSSTLQWLARVAQNPQGDGGTQWTAVGSYGDAVVTQTSATTMGVRYRVKFSYPDVDHTGSANYMNRTSDSRNAVVYSSVDGGSWQERTSQPQPARWTDFALATPDR